MQEFLRLRGLARAYVTAVVLLGFATVAYSLHEIYLHPLGRQWFILAALTLLTGSFTVRVPSTNASLSVSETFVFASVLLFGPAAGAITVLLECLIILFWMKPGSRPLHRVLFNTVAPAIAIWCSGTVFFSISAIQPYSVTVTPLEALFLPLAVFTLLYFLLNSWLVAFALGFETGKSPFEIWSKNFTWLSVNYFSGASVAALLVTYTRRIDASTLVIIVPLLVVSYLTFRTAMGRVEDASVHLSELNRLYLSTIETLAMAIDAKDQVTHGHIRRVQQFATGLATAIGVRDETLLKAIEAAALLHDMGKLAVPEYILNKPGKLTPAEFEKMKLHASVGADILSAIDFPYPVVPIVRHHHENWDGSGYPSGIRGTDIPIGARILSVVDCFDALTSDRPYRPRLSDAEAIQILLDRRGSMYDPLVVDTFVRVHSAIAPQPSRGALPSQALNEIATARKASAFRTTTPVLEGIAASTDEMLTLYGLARALSDKAGNVEAADVIAQHIRRLIPCSMCVFYKYNAAIDELVAESAVGDGASFVRGLSIQLGQRLSGWVGANRQTIVNSDPILDFGDIARAHALGLKSCISTPLISADSLVGVLSLYSAEAGCFTDDHRRIIEVVARQIVARFKTGTSALNESGRDVSADLPSIDSLAAMVRPLAISESPYALLFIDLLGLRQIRQLYGSSVSDEVLRGTAGRIRQALRNTDILFGDDYERFVAFLDGADVVTANTVATRISNYVSEQSIRISGSSVASIELAIYAACSPPDGGSISELRVAARAKALSSRPPQAPGVH